MRVIRGFDEDAGLNAPVAAIGSFDGVHLGHCRVLRYLCDFAHQTGGDSVVVTFDPHPQQVLRPNSDFFNINSLDKNIELIEKQGVDAVLIVPFTQAFSQLSYSDFIDQYMIGKLRVSTLVMGPNHALGHNRAGGREAIENLCNERGVHVVELPEMVCHDVAVHSAMIRKLITEGRWDDVDELLGYHYDVETQFIASQR
ncbi:MAG: FAD synthetase family protein [Bacteroidales bacterium]|nr:FAD synthetase family protein [Bacteroidales bacterium]MBR6162110.1 FAD synthetase family protein [Bacteroidales bacterium]